VNYNQRTQEEIELTNFYLDKWDKILYSTKPVDRSKAEQAVFDAYQSLGMSPPEIFFLTSPSPSESLRLNSLMPNDPGSFLCLKGDLDRAFLEVLKEKSMESSTNLSLSINNYLWTFNYSNKGEMFENLCCILYEPAIYSDPI
jgi:hypothetical protein